MSLRPHYKFLEIGKNRHGKETVYFRRGRGQRVRLPSLTNPDFSDRYQDALAGRKFDVREMPVTPIAKRKQRTEAAMRACLRAARTRSRKRGSAFNLTLDWLLQTVEAQGFRCALTGIEFYADAPHRGKVHPYIPSLDRIDATKGYTQDNVRVVLHAVNTMLLDWGPLVFEQVAKSYRYWQGNGKRKSIPAPSLPNSRTLKNNR